MKKPEESPEIVERFDELSSLHVFRVVDHHEGTVDLRIETHAAYINGFVRPDVVVLFLCSGKRKIIFVKGDFPPCNFYGKSVRGADGFHHHHGADLPARAVDHVGGKFRKPSFRTCFEERAGTENKGENYEKRKKKTPDLSGRKA